MSTENQRKTSTGGVSREPSVTFSVHAEQTPRRAPNWKASSHNGSVCDDRSPSQFNPATLDTQSIHSRRESHIRRSYSNLSDIHGGTGGSVVVYDPQQDVLPMMAPPPPFFLAVPPPPPIWFVPPPPPDAKTCRKMYKEMLKFEEKQFEANKPKSACYEFCCGSVATLLWIIISILVAAIVLSLVLAFSVL